MTATCRVATAVLPVKLVLVALVLSVASEQLAEAAKPNVVLIYIDDLGYGDLGCYGSQDIPTPHIDRLAREGVRCTASYITNPPCCPSRCSLIMGQYAQRFGKYGMSRGLPIPEDRPTLAEFLVERGYVSGHDLAADPEETADVASKNPEVVQTMSAEHRRWASSLSPLAEVPETRASKPIIPGGHGWALASPIK